jgi:ADP-ribosylglycohydrolase
MIAAMNAQLKRARRALEGLSVGDAFGECYFVPPKDALEMIATRSLAGGRWSWTDDTAMASAIYTVLAKHGAIDRDALAAEFARRYQRDPRRGYGATAHEILANLGLGAPWREIAGAVFEGKGSMGNGGAMRAAPVGAYFAEDYARAAEEARASAEVTHAHPEGKAGAIAAAVATAWAWQHREDASVGAAELFETVLRFTPEGSTKRGIELAAKLPDGTSVAEAVTSLGNGSRVISEDTVPFALWCAAHHLDDYEDALWTTVSGLGDRDTTCAITGGIVVFTSEAPIPEEWLAAREPLQID